jgi:tRNA(fMet)-specific endonuclease VapC
MICLDTNAVIAALNVSEQRVRGRLERTLAGGVTIGIPAIVLYELWYGINKSARPKENAAALAAFLALNMSIWPFESEDAEEAGDIRASLERAGKSIGPYDVLIAAQARRRGAVLVTANSREFGRVPRLKVEDWQSGP